MFALPDHHIVAFSGRDATAFAQAQFMNNAADLAVGHWQWSGWLTPKGRVIALFALLKSSDERIWLLLRDADPSDIADRLQRFVFRSKVAISARDDLHASGAFEPPTRARGAQMDSTSENEIVLDQGGAGGPRHLQIGTTAAVQDAHCLARWTAFDLMHGLPRLSSSQCEQWTPQQLSLDRLQAYSVRKGCYPGQEIVARTHFLGQAKRGLVLFESELAHAPGAQVIDGERTSGSIVSAVDTGERRMALAVLSLDPDVAAPHADGDALHRVALLDGLVR